MKSFLKLTVISLTLLICTPAFAAFELVRSPDQNSFAALWSHEKQEQASRIMGLEHRDVLSMDGDPNGSACSEAHKQNDLSNRWCHALFVKLAKDRLSKDGFSEIAASLLSATIFLPKEYMIDQKPSLADLVITEFSLADFDNESGNVALSIFGDGAFILSVSKTF